MTQRTVKASRAHKQFATHNAPRSAQTVPTPILLLKGVEFRGELPPFNHMYTFFIHFKHSIRFLQILGLNYF